MLQVRNRTLNAEKSNSLMMSHPHKDMRDLVQKKEMLEKEIMELTQQKINLQTVCTFICIQHLSHLAASPAGVAQQHRIMSNDVDPLVSGFCQIYLTVKYICPVVLLSVFNI
jgi:hypothetical protein